MVQGPRGGGSCSPEEAVGSPPQSLCPSEHTDYHIAPLPLPVVALVRFCSLLGGPFWVTYPGGLQRVVDP